MIAIQDESLETDEGKSPIVGVVELQLREPDGSLPSDLPFRAPWRSLVSEQGLTASLPVARDAFAHAAPSFLFQSSEVVFSSLGRDVLR